MRATGRDESQSGPPPRRKNKKTFKTRDLELPFFEGSLPNSFAALCGIHPSLSTPVLPRCQLGDVSIVLGPGGPGYQDRVFV